MRNNHPVAKIIPGPAATMTALEAMSDLYQTSPKDAAATWTKDSREGAAADLSEVRDPWAS